MINAIVYLDASHNPAPLLDALLQKELVATVSIDIDNAFYTREKMLVRNVAHTVLTMQTRALLFNEICKVVAEMFGEHIPVHSVPIVSANASFEKHIRSNTREPDHRIQPVTNQ